MLSGPAAIDHPRGLLLFGAGGLLGSAIRAHRPAPALRWTDVQGLSRTALRDRLEPGGRPIGPLDVVFACGLTDPRAPAGALKASNVEFPQRVIEALEHRSSVRFLTFGTVFEHFDGAVRSNPYYASKNELGSWMRCQPAGRFLHLRLHTLYGSRLNPRMFLGLMIDALRAGRPFPMTTGRQLREYHHVDDVAAAVHSAAGHQWTEGVVHTVSSGRPVRLVDLATAVFETAGRPDLLQVGALGQAPAENVDQVFERSPPWLLPLAREPLPAIRALVPRWLAG